MADSVQYLLRLVKKSSDPQISIFNAYINKLFSSIVIF